MDWRTISCQPDVRRYGQSMGTLPFGHGFAFTDPNPVLPLQTWEKGQREITLLCHPFWEGMMPRLGVFNADRGDDGDRLRA